MTIEIKSKVRPEQVLHEVYRFSELAAQDHTRVDLGAMDNFLQVAPIRVKTPRSFAAHSHLPRARSFSNFRAMEAWVVIRGAVKVDYYDVDDTLLQSHTLLQGDLTVTYLGGHGFEVLSEDSLFYEFKTGPYEGQAIDKRYIE